MKYYIGGRSLIRVHDDGSYEIWDSGYSEYGKRQYMWIAGAYKSFQSREKAVIDNSKPISKDDAFAWLLQHEVL